VCDKGIGEAPILDGVDILFGQEVFYKFAYACRKTEIPKILDQTRNHVIDASVISKKVAKVEAFQPGFCR